MDIPMLGKASGFGLIVTVGAYVAIFVATGKDEFNMALGCGVVATVVALPVLWWRERS